MKKSLTFIAGILLALPLLTNAHDVHAPVKSNLGLGSKGAEVTALQKLLAQVPNIYPEGLVTGYFGSLTEKAIKRLQAINSLEPVGFVGPKTKALLEKINTEAAHNRTLEDFGFKVPRIDVIEATSTAASTGYVFWTTNIPSTSEFYYSTFSPLVSTTPVKITDTTRSASHSVNLSGLSTSTTYYYMIKIYDSRGNAATSTERSFTTTN